VVGAAGGPKGLALIPLDRWLFGEWLRDAPRRRELIGASIGAWRMAAASQRDAHGALGRLSHAYLECQRYPAKPSPAVVSRVCREIATELIASDASAFLRDAAEGWTLRIVTARQRHPDMPQAGSGIGAGPTDGLRDTADSEGTRAARLAFTRAALANALSRDRLAGHLQRVVFSRPAQPPCAALPRDRFATREVVLDQANLEDALLASGSIPLVAEPVRSIAGAPAGAYWDGGLIDYHPYWNFAALDGLVLYPHFVPRVTAGWLDKFLPWRRHGVGARGRGWLDNVLLLAPSDELLARLPNRKLPDRNDFYRYGTDHERRLRDWRRAIAECARMTEEFAGFVERPDPARLETL